MSAKTVSLGDICEFVNGGAWKQFEYADTGHPIVQVSNLKNDTFDLSDQKFLNAESIDKYKKHEIATGDLIIATVGSHPSQPSAAGRAAIATELISGMLLNQNAVLIRSISDELLQEYLCLVGRSPSFRSYVQYAGKGAANQVRIAIGAIKAFEFELPSLVAQQRIASVFDAYDDLIENNRRRIALLEEAARLLYREWFVYFRFPGHEHATIVDGVPEGWRKGTVADLGVAITGKTPSKKKPEFYGEDVPFIKTPDMHNNAYVVHTEEKISHEGAKSQQNKTLPKGAILVSCIGSVGVVSMNGGPAQTNQQINSVIPKKDDWRFFCYFFLKSIKPRLEALGGGATMANVNKTKFQSIPVLLPKDELIGVFQSIVEPQFAMIETLLRQNVELAKARDLLLPRLMDGRLEVAA